MIENSGVITKSGITGYHLKLIALITMLIDHIAAVVIWRIYKPSLDVVFLENRILIGGCFPQNTLKDNLIIWAASNKEIIYTIYEYMRLIGRMAFPIFCFLLVEGFLHTRSVKKYALRLLAFAFISEIPYDLAITGEWYSTQYSNVYFTLAISLVLIWLISYVEIFREFWMEKNWDPFLGNMITFIVGGLFVAIAGGFAEMGIHTDYGFAGVLAVLILYLFRNQRELGFILSVMILAIFSSSTEIIALLMLYPLMKYNGTRGPKTKYIFYAFYPVHLLVLAMICMGLGV